MPKNKRTLYIDNEKFYEAMVEYKNRCYAAKLEGKDRPQVTNYIAKCFVDIAENLAKSPSYSRYTWKDIMVSDAIINMLQYCDRFDESRKEKNPFGYFSMVATFSFWRRIDEEKKQLYVKYKIAHNMGIEQSEVARDSDSIEDNGTENLQETQLYDNIYEFIEKHERKQSNKKQRAKKPNVGEGVPKGLGKHIRRGADVDNGIREDVVDEKSE